MKYEESDIKLPIVQRLLNSLPPGQEIVAWTGHQRHPKCKRYPCNHYLDPVEYDCEYETKIDCDECKYNLRGGRKDPEAKCNQS